MHKPVDTPKTMEDVLALAKLAKEHSVQIKFYAHDVSSRNYASYSYDARIYDDMTPSEMYGELARKLLDKGVNVNAPYSAQLLAYWESL